MHDDRLIALGGAPPLGWSFSSNLSLEKLRSIMANFVDERDWHKFHTPRNILLALVGEVGEVAELFQFRGEVVKGCLDWSEKDKVHLGEELSDVLLYLLRLSDLCKIDLPLAALRKVEKNKAKYPVDRCKGRSDKYTAYQDTNSGKSEIQDTTVQSISKNSEEATTILSSSSSTSSVTPLKNTFPSLDENKTSPTISLLTRFNKEADDKPVIEFYPISSLMIVAASAAISGAVAALLAVRVLKR